MERPLQISRGVLEWLQDADCNTCSSKKRQGLLLESAAKKRKIEEISKNPIN